MPFTLGDPNNPSKLYLEQVKKWKADTAVKEFMLSNHPYPPHAPHLGGPPVLRLLTWRQFFIWDRLGRDGKRASSSKHFIFHILLRHYNITE